jgi:hypothetical protein
VTIEMRLRALGRLHPLIAVVLLLNLCLSTSAVADTETETHTGTYTSGTQIGIRFAMIPQPVQGQPGYQEGDGEAFIGVQDAGLSIHFGAEGMARGAHFTLVIIVDSVPHPVANFTTGFDESGAESYLPLPAGTYSLGLKVLDTSSFAAPTTVMISSPATQTLNLGQTTSTTTMTMAQTTQTISTVQGGKSEDDHIRSAIQNSFIAAVVNVGATGSSVQLNDRNFSASIGRYQQGGYIVSVSGVNGTGPRALLLNVTSAQSRSVLSGPISITLDSVSVQQASSLLQVLSAKAGDPSRFIIILTSTSLELLVTIPHFSSHVVAVAPIIASIQAALTVNMRLFVFSITIVTAVVATIYARRGRVVV